MVDDHPVDAGIYGPNRAATPSSDSMSPPPRDAIPGSYWALVKVMYFGRLLYTELVEVTIEAP